MFILTVGSSLLDQLLHETDTDTGREEKKTGSVYFIFIYHYIESLFICFKAQ